MAFSERNSESVRSVRGRLERIGAFGRQFRPGQDIGGRRQIALGVAADEFAILGEGDVAFDDARALASGGRIGLARMFGKLKRGAAMADRPVIGFHRLAEAACELVLERAVFQRVDEIGRPNTDFGRCRSALLGDRRPCQAGQQSQKPKILPCGHDHASFPIEAVRRGWSDTPEGDVPCKHLRIADDRVTTERPKRRLARSNPAFSVRSHVLDVLF